MLRGAEQELPQLVSTRRVKDASNAIDHVLILLIYMYICSDQFCRRIILLNKVRPRKAAALISQYQEGKRRPPSVGRLQYELMFSILIACTVIQIFLLGASGDSDGSSPKSCSILFLPVSAMAPVNLGRPSTTRML